MRVPSLFEGRFSNRRTEFGGMGELSGEPQL
jgi:hypothetical protein